MRGIESVLSGLGFVAQGEGYLMTDESLPTMLTRLEALRAKKRLVVAENTSPEEFRKEQLLAAERRAQAQQRSKEQAEKDKLKGQMEHDKQERLKMEVRESKSKELKFGTKATVFKDIGVDLCKKG